MTTFREFANIIRLAADDHDSRSRMGEIRKILKKHQLLREPSPEKAVAVLEELGPTFVKIGQIASNRSDMLPAEYCAAFESLRANVSPMTFEVVESLINESLGKPWQDVFQELDRKPLGSASIAQVHRAVLNNGDVVAVKVRRPGIVDKMKGDISLLYKVIAIAEFLTPANQLLKSIQGLVEELERTTLDELNFEVELNNLMRFSANMEKSPGITSPKAYPEFSTGDVLVMEFIAGLPIDKVKENQAVLKESGVDMGELGLRLAQNYVSQVLDDGFFHADPHPGNAIVRDGEIVWIDLGMTGRLTPTQRSIVGRMFLCIATSDAYGLKEALLGLTDVEGEADQGRLLSELETLIARYGNVASSDLDVGAALMDVIYLLKTHGIALPSALTMLGRGFITVEGAVSELSDDIGFVAILTKHVENQMMGESSMREKAKELLAATASSAEAAARLPRQAGNTLDMVQKGHLRMNMDLHMSNGMLGTTYTLVGNVCLSLIAAALYVGSALLCTSNVGGPELLQVPAIGVAGFTLAFLLTVYIVFVTLRTRHRIRNNLEIY